MGTSSTCENCGFTGERAANGACARCGHGAAGFRVPPLPSPEGAVSAEVGPDAEVPPGGYLDLDLGEGSKPEDPPAEFTPALGTPRRRPTQRTGPAFAAVAPKEVPGSAKSIVPIVVAVAVGSLVLILVGFLARSGGESPAAPAAPVAAAPAQPAPGPAAPRLAAAEPGPAAEPGQPAPALDVKPAAASPASGGAVTPAALSTPAATTRREARPEPRTARRPAPEPPRARERIARPEPAAPAPPAPAPAPTPAPASSPAAAAAAAVPVPAAPTVIEDAPRYAAEGYRRPQMAEPQCVQRSIRAPRDLADRVDGPVTIRFAVGPDGGISLFQVMGDVPDPRLPGLLESAVRSCTFVAGADAQGRPVRMWVTMPIRFAR